jgi:hypothetical protein
MLTEVTGSYPEPVESTSRLCKEKAKSLCKNLYFLSDILEIVRSMYEENDKFMQTNALKLNAK